MAAVYTEPYLAVLVLDYRKPIESRLCLESIKRHLKVPHHVIFCDNGGGEDYPMAFVREGLIDQLIVNRDSRGLGLGTRDLFALTFASWTIYLQNDQVFARDLTQDERDRMFMWYGGQTARREMVASISLAGAPCGDGVYSERAHLIRTADYKQWEGQLYLGHYGAGQYHNGEWREATIQRHYRTSNLTHLMWPHPLVADNGVYAVRDMGPEGGMFCHRTDTKQLWVIRQPIILDLAYPKVTPGEENILLANSWADGAIPELEAAHSFRCWDHTPLAQMQDEYIDDLRRRVAQRSTL